MRAVIAVLLLIGLGGCMQNIQQAAAVAGPAAAARSASPCTVDGTLCTVSKTALSGTRMELNHATALNPDCSSMGQIVGRVLQQPANGQITLEQGTEYPNYTKDNQRYSCNLKKAPALLTFYTPNPGFVGSDTATIESIYPNGGHRTVQYNLTVK